MKKTLEKTKKILKHTENNVDMEKHLDNIRKTLETHYKTLEKQ